MCESENGASLVPSARCCVTKHHIKAGTMFFDGHKFEVRDATFETIFDRDLKGAQGPSSCVRCQNEIPFGVLHGCNYPFPRRR